MFKIQTKCLCFQTIYSYQLPTGPDVIFFFMLNSAEHAILNARKYKKYREIKHFVGSDKPRMLFFLLIKVEMPTFVGISTFLSRENFMLS